MRGIGADEDEDDERLLTGPDVANDGEVTLEVDEEQLLLDYKHLFWSRIITVDGFEVDLMQMWPLGPDIIEECKAVAGIQPDDIESWVPLFEPADFNDAHGPLKLEDYQLSQEELKTWAERVIKIRADIMQKAKISAETEADIVETSKLSDKR